MRDNLLDLSHFATDARFECPRCRSATRARFYGPCPECVAILQASVTGPSGRSTAPAEYEPKINVTPNAVALKDD